MPARKYFYSSTKDRKIGDDGEKSDGHITFKDYLTCEKIWNKFDIEDMGDYHNHYLKKHILLLADVFERLIGTCLKFHGLDPCHYFSSPGLSWDAMLKMTGIELEKYQALTSTKLKYVLKRDWEEEFLTLLKDMQKPITDT